MTRRDESWVATRADADARQQALQGIVGLPLTGVTYYDLDYRQLDRAGSAAGPRAVVDPVELADPTWLFRAGHSLDWGVELHLGPSTVLTITWQSPGNHEGLITYDMPLVGATLLPDANTAVWDVTNSDPWRALVGQPVTQADVGYVPWGTDGYWCPNIDITIGDTPVTFTLAEASAASDTLLPSANNVVVLLPGHPRPDWLSGR